MSMICFCLATLVTMRLQQKKGKETKRKERKQPSSYHDQSINSRYVNIANALIK